MASTLNLADSETAMLNGTNYDGFIRKVKKYQIDFFARGKEYTITRRGIIASRTKLADGKTWYSYQIDDLCESYSAEVDFAADMLRKYGIAKLPG